jgi:hypothetical protein
MGVSSQVMDGGASRAQAIRRAMEVIEEAPAEALCAKLLQTLPQAGIEADLHGAADVSRKVAFAYKLAVELGGKLGVLSREDLDVRRQLAAALFGKCEAAAAGSPHGPHAEVPFEYQKKPAG